MPSKHSGFSFTGNSLAARVGIRTVTACSDTGPPSFQNPLAPPQSPARLAVTCLQLPRVLAVGPTKLLGRYSLHLPDARGLVFSPRALYFISTAAPARRRRFNHHWPMGRLVTLEALFRPQLNDRCFRSPGRRKSAHCNRFNHDLFQAPLDAPAALSREPFYPHPHPFRQSLVIQLAHLALLRAFRPR